MYYIIDGTVECRAAPPECVCLGEAGTDGMAQRLTGITEILRVMRIKKYIEYCGKYALPLMIVFFCGCAERDETIRDKLEVILREEDMPAILEGVAEEALLEEPYFDVLEYRTYREGAYSRMAIVDFHFLRPMDDGRSVMIKRRYRYHKRLGMWDRYYNKYYITDGEVANETEI